MLSRNDIKRVKSLQQKKVRDELGLFVAEGYRLVEQILAGGFEIVEVYHTEKFTTNQRIDANLIAVSESEMSRISGLTAPSPVLAVAKYPEYTLNADPASELVLALDTVQDPGNMGTIIRLADWFGVNHVVCSNGCTDAFAPKTIQATMGAIANVKVHYVDLTEWLSNQKGSSVYGAFMDGENIYSMEKKQTGIIIMGNEGNGISKPVEPFITHRIHIPSFAIGREKVESLNVAMAAAIVLSEFKGHSSA